MIIFSLSKQWITQGHYITQASKWNRIAGCLLASHGVFAMMYINNGDKEQCRAVGIQNKYDQIIIIYLLILLPIFRPDVQGFFRIWHKMN